MAKVQDLKGLYVLEGVKGKRFKQEIMIPYNYNQGHNLNPSEGEYECLGRNNQKSKHCEFHQPNPTPEP